MKADKITLEPTEDGKRWRIRPEGGDFEGDVEAHAMRWKFSVEPSSEGEGGEPVYRVTADGEDVEGHLYRWSDAKLKRVVTPLIGALDGLKALGTRS